MLAWIQEPFDLVLTQDFMVVINDNVSANRRDRPGFQKWSSDLTRPPGYLLYIYIFTGIILPVI